MYIKWLKANEIDVKSMQELSNGCPKCGHGHAINEHVCMLKELSFTIFAIAINSWLWLLQAS